MKRDKKHTCLAYRGRLKRSLKTEEKDGTNGVVDLKLRLKDDSYLDNAMRKIASDLAREFY